MYRIHQVKVQIHLNKLLKLKKTKAHLSCQIYASGLGTKTFVDSILHNHEVDRIQAEAGFGEGFFEFGLVGL